MPLKKRNWASILTLAFLIIGSLAIGGGALLIGLSPLMPREGLEEVSGRVSSCIIKRTDTGPFIEVRLLDDKRTFRFSDPEEKVNTVYSGLRVGGDVVLLVEESWHKHGYIWEGRSNGNVFLHYETVAEWTKNNKRGNLGVGLGFLVFSGFFACLAVLGIKKGWFYK